MKRIIWICGWASDLSPWQTEISAHIPAEHTFVAFDQWFDGQDIPTGDFYILWSMGFYALGQIPNPNAKIMALFPAIHFCGPNGWAPRIVQRMIKQLKSTPDNTLEAFAQQMQIPTKDLNQWINCAKRMKPSLLETGLTALLEQAPVSTTRFDILRSSIDQICPHSQCHIDNFRGQYFEIQAPHWPVHTDTLITIADWLEKCP